MLFCKTGLPIHSRLIIAMLTGGLAWPHTTFLYDQVYAALFIPSLVLKSSLIARVSHDYKIKIFFESLPKEQKPSLMFKD